MANILLTKKKNKKCPYCFASYNEGNDYISKENFVKAIKFLKKTPGEKIGLLGGEPLLHPEFAELCNILNEDRDIRDVVVFTNGILLDKYFDCFMSMKYAFLINCNERAFYAPKIWERLRKNIEEIVHRVTPDNVLLGLNIYKTNMDIDALLELSATLAIKKLRISLVIPNSVNAATQRSQFDELKPELFRVYERCVKIGVIPQFDCNQIPLCFYSKEDIAFIKTLFGSSLNSTNILQVERACRPVIDIYPDLTACRCFGATDIRLKLSNYRNARDLKNAFISLIDKNFYGRICRAECANCYLNQTLNCMGGCFSYNI